MDTYGSGLFIALEGIDGCGKGTQAKILADRLFDLNKRHHVFLTREPGRSDYGSEIRKILKEETDPYNQGIKLAELFVTDRKKHIEVIRPVLDYGGIVISDRYKHSTLAYQNAQGIPLGDLIDLHDGLIVPDITLFFDLPADVAADRLASDTTREYEESFEKVDFQEKLREKYLELPEHLVGERIEIIDARQSIEQIAEEVFANISPLLEQVS